jgi:hypothetical protein
MQLLVLGIAGCLGTHQPFWQSVISFTYSQAFKYILAIRYLSLINEPVSEHFFTLNRVNTHMTLYMDFFLVGILRPSLR